MLRFKLPTKKAFFSKKTKFKPKIMFFFFGRAASPPLAARVGLSATSPASFHFAGGSAAIPLAAWALV
jgi:hypothetical protein